MLKPKAKTQNNLIKPLTGLSALITRPQKQAMQLMNAITAAGGSALCLPIIEICPPANERSLQHTLKNICDYDIAIFVSANAVPIVKKYLLNYPDNITTIAIGSGTASELQQANIPVHYIPKSFNSEGVLNLSVMKSIRNKKIVIFCGENPRAHLADVAKIRGAMVTLAYCYRRQLPAIDMTKEFSRLQNAKINVVICTSCESLTYLYQLFSQNSQWLETKTLVLISQRMVEKLKELSPNQSYLLAENATEKAIVNAISKLPR